ncbi:hypothetical protein EX461_23940 [Vibrio parahaemolyticus]|nr:hypothetical protein [Vibrio parahaemolyticus]EJG0013990.1 hypothetical protein [Vibrio parahaemolyticus]EJG0782031.1 hypothetical protein [Vibrio parahaemolyticus]EJS9799241.1 hypothetical protein [Vibrio parahaemolyticus]
MNTYTKIRKNASKKLAALFAKATKITVDVQVLDWYTDCYETNTRKADLNEVHEFVSKNYGDVTYTLVQDEEGNDLYLTVSTSGWSKYDFHIDFRAQEPEVIKTVQPTSKPRLHASTVAKMIEVGFVAPLSSIAKIEEQGQEQDEDKQILSVKVLWSESGYFNRALRSTGDDINKEITLIEYNKLAALQVAACGKNWIGGYYKTKVELTTANGVFTFRHDISPKEPTLQGEWSAWVDYVRAEQAEKVVNLH